MFKMPHYHNAHAALIDEDGFVQEVIVIPYMEDDDEKITEYCNSLGLEGTWLDCSYTGSRRGRFPGIGFLYDPDLNEFLIPEIETE
jgi:hypothetical protein